LSEEQNIFDIGSTIYMVLDTSSTILIAPEIIGEKSWTVLIDSTFNICTNFNILGLIVGKTFLTDPGWWSFKNLKSCPALQLLTNTDHLSLILTSVYFHWTI
jgi:hypothetical protein